MENADGSTDLAKITGTGATDAATDPPLRSVHTTSFAQALNQFNISLAVTTYQAGKLVFLRAEQREGNPVVNTHFRSFDRPMGLAWEKGRIALGTSGEIWEFHDMPAVARKIDAVDAAMTHDAVFLPRIRHQTGEVQIHEMVWQPVNHSVSGGGTLSELWFVNTRFSCLCTRSGQFSFVPRWQPKFITALAPEDRCHLNGVCLRDGKVRYVTALGETDTAGGWRANKRDGGLLIDIQSNEILARGLSMPHSPRWHGGRLWVLESGRGGLGFIDPSTRKYQEVCRLPGFTRGLDFAGPLAFVGLSQVRETAVFGGIPIAELPQDQRHCGVWAVDTRTGKIVAFVKFTDAVQEVFAVQVLHQLRWPEMLNEQSKLIAESYELPEEALRQVPAELRQASDR
jgi:uncharacterized protein (TIGR03032 family)